MNFLTTCLRVEQFVNVRRLAVQWHTFADPTKELYEKLIEKLHACGYARLWSFWPTLEAYERVA
jgi:hypothetical protein